MGSRRHWIERKARRVIAGKLNGRGGGSPASRTHRPHGSGGGGLPPQVQRGIRQVGKRLRRALRNR